MLHPLKRGFEVYDYVLLRNALRVRVNSLELLFEALHVPSQCFLVTLTLRFIQKRVYSSRLKPEEASQDECAVLKLRVGQQNYFSYDQESVSKTANIAQPVEQTVCLPIDDVQVLV